MLPDGDAAVVDDAGGAPALEAVFTGLGFRLTGRHRSKQVTRWSQGAINLVINTDRRTYHLELRATPSTRSRCGVVNTSSVGMLALQTMPLREAEAPPHHS